MRWLPKLLSSPISIPERPRADPEEHYRSYRTHTDLLAIRRPIDVTESLRELTEAVIEVQPVTVEGTRRRGAA